MKKVTGQGSKSRRPAAVDELEAAAKKLEDDVATLQSQTREIRTNLEAILRDNEALRTEVGNRSRGHVSPDDSNNLDGAGPGVLFL
jgi:phage shock protein A